MLDLCNDFQLVIDGLYDGPLPEQQFVRDAHQCAFHAVPQLRDERCAVNETHARTLAKQHLLDEQRQRNGHIALQLHKSVV